MKFAVLMSVGVPWSRAAARTLLRLGHQVHPIDFSSGKSLRDHLSASDAFQREEIELFARDVGGIRWMHTRWGSNLRYATAARSLRRILAELQPDALVTLYSGGSAVLARLSGFRPYCAWVVGSEVLADSGLRRKLLATALSGADLVLANGDTLAELTRALAPRARVQPLLLGVDVDELAPAPHKPSPVRILTNRGFSPIYQNDLIVQALRLVDPERVGDYRFVFASSGPDLQATIRLADQVLPAGVRERVEFLGGVSRTRMLELLAESRIFISMAKSEGTATSLLEAMACGVYPIVADIPQNREWVDEAGGCGTLVPASDASALARAIEAAVRRDDREFVAHNRRFVTDRADAARNMGRFAELASAFGRPR